MGFAFYGYWQERDRYLLCRYMIDVRYQGRGYGTRRSRWWWNKSGASTDAGMCIPPWTTKTPGR